MGICERKLPVSQDGLSVIDAPISGSAFHPGNNAALMHMAATLDKPLIVVFNRPEDVKRMLQERESDRRLRLEQVHALTGMLRESEADRAARLDQIDALAAMLKESEADRATRLDQIVELTRLLKESETDRAARLEVIQRLGITLAEEKKRADGLERERAELEGTFIVRQARRAGLIKVRRFAGPAASLGGNE
jgi:hypothetical protein